MARRPTWCLMSSTILVTIVFAFINIYLLMYLQIYSVDTVDGANDSIRSLEHQNTSDNNVTLQGKLIFQTGNDITNMHTDSMIDKLIEHLKYVTKPNAGSFFPSYFWNMKIQELTRKLGYVSISRAKTLSTYANNKTLENVKTWELVHRNIRQFSLYLPDDPNIDKLMRDLSTLPIIKTDDLHSGTQFKILVQLKDGGCALLKPMRYGREVEADENRFVFDDIERHVAEIAAFQLDRVLGFYRVPPTVGRRVNITSELKPVASESIKKTMFRSPDQCTVLLRCFPAGNLCFYGKCTYYCERAHSFCGHPDIIEVSMMMFLPLKNTALRKWWYQPWRRSYSMKKMKAYWEEHDDLCDVIRYDSPFNNGKILLDIIDAHTFDFLTGNKDRHSFETFTEFGNYSFPILLDNGKGFGRKTYDAMSILAPLKQCCLIRKSTFLKYAKLYLGPEKLSDLMGRALQNDPVAPVLTHGHLTALDRRVVKILRVVAECLQKHDFEKVIISDRY